MYKHLIFGNYGNETIALIQWAFEAQLEGVAVAHVDTGWAGAGWDSRVSAGQELASGFGFKAVALESKGSFADFVKDRGGFPTQKFQWCPTVLKGLPVLEWLNEVDPDGEMTVLMGKRRGVSRANLDMQEFIPESEFFRDRRVWFPLFQHSLEERDALIQRAVFDVLPHRSLECDPCIHSSTADLRRMNPEDIKKTAQLEQEVGKNLFGEQGIRELIKSLHEEQPSNYQENFDMGCGSVYGCGE